MSVMSTGGYSGRPVVSAGAAVSRRPVLAMLASGAAVLAVLTSGAFTALASPATFLTDFGSFERPTGVAVEESTGERVDPRER